MKTVRRLYFYAVAFISLEVVLWGLINLLRSIVDETVGGAADALARALALIVVGVPIFLVHWLWAQRTSARDEEERSASLRAVFLYAALFGTLVPVVQNLLALINRLFLQSAHMAVERALFGGSQTLPDNLIAILANGLVAYYFWNITRGEWKSLPGQENLGDVRRLYHYLWVIYALLMVIFGAQQLLRFMFYGPSGMLGEIGQETLVNGIALLVVGTPIWVYAWRVVQDSLAAAVERESNLRLGILYLLALAGVITVLSAAGTLLDVFLRRWLGETMAMRDLLDRISGPISIGVPLGAIWAYYGYWLKRHIESVGDPVRQAGMQRLYFYILSAIGLTTVFLGMTWLLRFMIDVLTIGPQNLLGSSRLRFADAVSTLAVGLPLWLLTWRPMQAEGLAQNQIGGHARQSVVRKAYSYLALFAGVIGGMIAAVALVFELLKALLTGQTDGSFLSTLLNELQLLFLFSILLVYHLTVLRRDGILTADSLAAKQSDFKLLVLDSGEGFAASVEAALGKLAPGVPVTIAAEKPQGNFSAVVLNGSSAVNAPEWVRSFGGSRIIVPDETKGYIWAGGVSKQAVDQAAQAVRQLAEGREVRQLTDRNPGWMIAVYLAAALFGLELLFLLLGLLLSTFIH